MSDLLSGQLKDILSYILIDDTLDLEIRDNYFNIYYRGGNILKVNEKGKHQYEYQYDQNYLTASPHLSNSVLSSYKIKFDWNNYFPMMKQAMDFYFSNHSKEERENQQLVVRENNYSSIANGTDFFIIDIEYDNHSNARFDLIAIEWPSNASIRKLSKKFKPKLVVIEMKYGDGAFKGTAGIHKHISDFETFNSKTNEIQKFKKEMLGVLKQKRQLGLIPSLSQEGNSNHVTQFADEIEMMFLIANHDPASTILQSELSGLKNQKIKFVTSNFMGYGLFLENVFNYDSFIQRFKSQISNEI